MKTNNHNSTLTVSKNTVILGTFYCFNSVLQFLFFLALVRLVPKADIDYFELGRSCLEIGAGIICAGFDAIIIRETSRSRSWWNEYRRSIFFTLLGGSLIIAYVIYLINSNTFDHFYPRFVIGFFCFAIVFQSLSESMEAFYRSQHNFLFPVYVSSVCSVISLTLALLLILFVSRLVLWAALFILIRWAIQFFWLSRGSKMMGPQAANNNPFLENVAYLYREVLPVSIGAISFILYARIDVMMLGWYGLSDSIAFYGCAYRPIGFLVLLISAFYKSFSPRLSQIIQLSPKNSFWTSMKVGLSMCILGGILCFLIITYRENVISFLYPQEFADSVRGIFALAWTLPIVYFGNAFGFYLVYYGKRGAWIYAWISVIGLLVNVIGNMVLIPRYGYVGSAWMTVATDGITTLLMVVCVILLIFWFSKKENKHENST